MRLAIIVIFALVACDSVMPGAMEGGISTSAGDSRGVGVLSLPDGRLVIGFNEECSSGPSGRKLCRFAVYWFDSHGNSAGATYKSDPIGEMTFLVAGTKRVFVGGYRLSETLSDTDIVIVPIEMDGSAGQPIYEGETFIDEIVWSAIPDGEGFIACGETEIQGRPRAAVFSFDANAHMVRLANQWTEDGAEINETTRALAVARRATTGFIIVGERNMGAKGSDVWIARLLDWSQPGQSLVTLDSGSGSLDRANAIVPLMSGGYLTAGTLGEKWWILPLDENGAPLASPESGVLPRPGFLKALLTMPGGGVVAAGSNFENTSRTLAIVWFSDKGVIDSTWTPSLRIPANPTRLGELMSVALGTEGRLIVTGSTPGGNQTSTAFFAVVSAW